MTKSAFELWSSIVFLSLILGAVVVYGLNFLRYCLLHLQWRKEARNPFMVLNEVDGPQNHAGRLFKVRSEILGKTVRLTWDFKPSIRHAGYQLVRTRIDNGADTGQSVTCYEDGELCDPVTEGRSYFYTLKLKKEPFLLPPLHLWLKKDLTPDSISFNLVVPTAEDRTAKIQQAINLAKLEKQLQDLLKAKDIDPNAQKIETIRKEVHGLLQLTEELDHLEKWYASRIEASASSKEEKADKLERLRSMIAAMKDQI